MSPTCRKIENFLVGSEFDRKGRHIITVFLNAMPVTRFNADENAERRQAAIQLVELGLCSKTIAGEIFGFHRNTVADLLKTKELLGLEAVLVESRGRKEPVKYINEVQRHIRQLQEKHPDWSDQKIANQAAKDLNMEISRNAVARIRIKDEPPKPKQPSKQELLDMAKVAEETAKEHSPAQQLKLPFELDPEFKKKQEELAETNPLRPRPRLRKNSLQNCNKMSGLPLPGS
jgi:transposase